MQILGSVFVVCGFIAMTNAVCAPSSWEGVELGKVAVEGKDGKPGQVLGLMQNVSFDSVRGMEVLQQALSSETEGWVKQQTIYIDYNGRMMYTADPNARTCQRQVFNETMIKFCSDNPKLQHIASLNVDSQMADVYYLRTQSFESTLTVMSDSFIPISGISTTNVNGLGEFIAVQIGNVTAGIADNDVFTLPDYCMPHRAMSEMLCKVDQYESVQIGKSARADGRVDNIMMTTASDYNRQMEVSRQTVYLPNGTYNATYYLDFKNQMRYTYSPSLNTCTKSPFNATMERICRDNPHLMYKASLKMPNIMADIYELTGTDMRYTITMARDNFVPIGSYIEGSFNGVQTAVALQHGNYTTSVDDSVFTLPTVCN